MTESLGLFLCTAIALVFVCFPEESYFYSEKTILLLKLVAINTYCWLIAVQMYGRLLLAFRRVGLTAPPFRYTPVWKRQ